MCDTMTEFKELSEEDVEHYLNEIQCDERVLSLFLNKSKFRRIFIPRLKTSLANILKQEALSVGADVAVSKFSVGCEKKFTPLLILATQHQLIKIKNKIKAMNIKTLSELMDQVL